MFGMIRHMRPAEDDQDVGPLLFQTARDLERDPGIPDIGAEADDIGSQQVLTALEMATRL